MQKAPLIISHRGGRDWAPENTLAAFRKSIELGVGGIEFDVHRCASGELVVIHDDDLNRTTNGVGLVKDSSYAELKRLSAGLWFDKEFREERVPLLAEVLDLCNENMLVDIEIKNSPIGYEGIEADLLGEIETYRKKLQITVSSFDHHCLMRLRMLDSQISLGILASASLVDLRDYAEKFNASYYIQDYDCLMPESVQEAKEAGLELIVWTVNDKQKWKRLMEMGVQGICTDLPQALRNFYEEQGLSQQLMPEHRRFKD